MGKALLALLALLAPVAPVAPRSQFDHLVVAVRSLPEGIAEFERLTGIKAGVGGRHPGRGTENALVSLGDGRYLEILAPQAGARLAASDEGMRALEHLRIIGWAVRVSDVQEGIKALGGAGFAIQPPQPGSRVTPSGERLEWSTFDLADQSLTVAPFFIHWTPATKHPSTTAPGGCTLAELEVQDPASDRLAAALGALGVEGVAYTNGASRIEARLVCGGKTATLASS
jgi:Glyoxalase-like domain